MISPEQIKLIHVAKGKASLNDAQYRTVLANVGGGVASSKEIDQEGFENCMAVFEDEAAQRGIALDPRDPEKWRQIVARRRTHANSRMVHKIDELFAAYREMAVWYLEEHEQYKLPGLVVNASRGRTAHPRELTPREAWNLIEMLKKLVERTSDDSKLAAATKTIVTIPAEEVPF